MAIGDTKNPNLFGTDYNAGEEERKRLEAEASLAAQNARIGSGMDMTQENPDFGAMLSSSGIPNSNVSSLVPGIENIKNPGAFDPTNIEPDGPVGPPTTVGESISQTYNESVLADLINKGFGQEAFQSKSLDGTPTYSIYNKRFGTLGSQVPYSEASPEAKGQAMNFMLGTGGQERPLPETPTSPVLNAEQVQGVLNEQQAIEAAQDQQGTPNVDQVLQDGAGSVQPGEVDVAKPPTMPENGQQLEPELEIRRGEEGSSQRYFTDITDERPLTPEEIKLGKAFADRRGFDFDPETGFSVMDKPGSRKFDTPATRENFRNRGLTFTQFLRGENDPSQRTEEFVDPQGRLRRRFTSEAARLQGYSERDIAQNRPLAPEFAEDKAAGDKFMAKLRAQRTGEAKESDGEMSFSDAKRRAKGQLAARGIDGASASMVNDLARSIQDAEPERLEGLETEKAVKEARIKTAEAELNRPEFKGKVYTVDGVTFAQTSRGGVQVISTGTEDPEKTTREAQKFEFTKKKIEDARKAYEEGDLTKSNDILAAANIQQYGIQANATQYFADSTPQVTPPAPPVTGSGLTQQQEDNITRQAFDTMGEAEAANLPKGTKITIGGRNATV